MYVSFSPRERPPARHCRCQRYIANSWRRQKRRDSALRITAQSCSHFRRKVVHRPLHFAAGKFAQSLENTLHLLECIVEMGGDANPLHSVRIGWVTDAFGPLRGVDVENAAADIRGSAVAACCGRPDPAPTGGTGRVALD